MRPTRAPFRRRVPACGLSPRTVFVFLRDASRRTLPTRQWERVIAALAAVKTWRFKPAVVSGQPTAVFRIFKVPFRLKS